MDLEEFQHLRIQLEEIKLATGNFNSSKVIGKGGFGVVHEGVLSHSKKQTMVAFKRLDRRHGQGDPEFWKEILMLSRYTHENLISLVGFCDQDGEKILVYEHAFHGSLDRHLSSPTLKWKQRLKICLGAAMGLCYLHDPNMTQQRVIHRDIKSSNILLDENWNAKISDMGLSKIGPANQQHTFLVSNVVGTFGYVDPMYAEMSILTKESDVYSFGVDLFEVLCGRLCFENNNNHFQNLVPMWKKSFKQKKLDEIIFQDLKQHIDMRSVEVFSDTAYQCLQKSRKKRPKMLAVVEKLEIALQFQEEFEETEPSMDYHDMNKTTVPPLVYRSKEELKMLLSKMFGCCFSSPNPNKCSDIHEGDLEKWLITSSPSLSSISAAALVIKKPAGKRIDEVGKKKYVKKVTGRHNDTELHLAAKRGDLAAVKKIFADISLQMVGSLSGTDFDTKVAEIRASMVSEVNELRETALYAASEKGHLEVVKELLKYSNKATILKQSRLMFDPLHVAASQGHHAVVQLLLDHDASLCYTTSLRNTTPLITAASKGHTAVVHELLLRDPNLLHIVKLDGKSAVHIAVASANFETVKTLLEKDPQMARRTDKKGQTALHMAAKGISSHVVKLLLEADPALLLLPDKFGCTALHVATRKKRIEIVNELLSLPDTNVNALTRDDKTPLDIVDGLPLSQESEDLRDCLLRYGALRANELSKPPDKHRNTLTQLKERLPMVNELVSSTSAKTMVLADSGKRIDQVGKKKYVKKVTGRHNDTQLHLAAQLGDLAAVKQILDDVNLQMVGTLSGANFDTEVAEIRASMVNEVNGLGETALYTASERGHLEVVKELLKYSDKATILKRSLSMYNPLHVAACQGHHAVVQLLLDHDVSLCRTVSVRNVTPLISAASRGHTAVVHELLSLLEI